MFKLVIRLILFISFIYLTACGGDKNIKSNTKNDDVQDKLNADKAFKESDKNATTLIYNSDTKQLNSTDFKDKKKHKFETFIYFNYNDDLLDEKDNEIIKYYSNILLDSPNLKVKLSGHTDERGSSEYNLALGERRVKIVEQSMLVFGVSQNRISTVSFGESKPFDLEHNKKAWSKNRRVEIKIY